MTNEIKDRFATSTALTITLNALASSTTGVGRQSMLVDNSSDRYQDVLVYVKITQGTSPTGNRTVQVFLLRDDADSSTPHITDGAGENNAGLTVQNAQLIGVMMNKASPTTGDVLYGEFVVNRPGPKWGIAIVHDTNADLKATDADHWVRYVGLNPEVQ